MGCSLHECGVKRTMKVLGGKWKPVILWILSHGTYRFSEIRRILPEITQKMLTQQVRELEGDGVVHREVYPVVPPKVEYSLTQYGETLLPILKAMEQWGRNHIDQMGSSDLDASPQVAK